MYSATDRDEKRQFLKRKLPITAPNTVSMKKYTYYADKVQQKLKKGGFKEAPSTTQPKPPQQQIAVSERNKSVPVSRPTTAPFQRPPAAAPVQAPQSQPSKPGRQQ